MNQPCDLVRVPIVYSAVPVLPYTPGGKPTPAAVPIVTTACIIGRSVLRTTGLIACGWTVCLGLGLSTSSGGRHVPLSTAATTDAWLSGLTRSLPCPKASAARSVGVRGRLKLPSADLALNPYSLAIAPSELPLSRSWASCANVVLQEIAKALRRVVVPSRSYLSLWILRPSIVTLLGHCTVLSGVMPCLARADAVTILNVDPGGKVPSIARSQLPGRSTIARTLPVDGWTTTMSTGLVVVADRTACDAASWTDMSMLVRTGLPSTAGKLCTVLPPRLPERASLIVSDGLPASRFWYACSIPPRPTGSPALYGAPSSFARAAVARATMPVSSAIDPDWATVAGELSTVPSAASICALAGQEPLSVNRSPFLSSG